MARKGHTQFHAFITAAALLLPLPALAQVNRVYEASAMIPTAVAGVRTFPEPRAGFDAVRASDIDLARYGLPPRPHDPESLVHWTAAMSAGARRSHEPIRKMPFSAGPAQLVGPMRATVASVSTAKIQSANWSGAVSVINVPTYDPAHSFSQVTAQFIVPFAQSAFAAGGGNVCTDDTWAVGWIGFDGSNSGDVLQGGWLAESPCANGTASGPPFYCLWAEWYPNNPILCQFSVSPGDAVFVEVWNTSQTQGYVYVQDLTTNVSQTVALTSAYNLFGNSVEYVIERPGSGGPNPLPLMNYVRNFIVGGSAETFDKITYTASGWSKPTPATWTLHLSMIELDSAGNYEPVSDYAQSGRHDLIFSAGGCALNGGC
jgi:hypothetical protein